MQKWNKHFTINWMDHWVQLFGWRNKFWWQFCLLLETVLENTQVAIVDSVRIIHMKISQVKNSTKNFIPFLCAFLERSTEDVQQFSQNQTVENKSDLLPEARWNKIRKHFIVKKTFCTFSCLYDFDFNFVIGYIFRCLTRRNNEALE